MHNANLVAAVVSMLALAAAPAASPLGRSEGGRAITVVARGAAGAPQRLLVVGCIHGNESAGIAIARRIEQLAPPKNTGVWIIPSLNPDGVAARTRGNSDGVDLNRNFPYRWQPLGGLFDSGPAALSEPESRLASKLIERIRPTISIWFHQHENLVDASGGDQTIERRYARLVGLPLRRLPRYPGSVVGWENHLLPRSTAFVVELPPGTLSPAQVSRFARAALMLVGGS